ncbi:MAG: hypothetical protein U0T69_04995 [Chitinophagales bacterium]
MLLNQIHINKQIKWLLYISVFIKLSYFFTAYTLDRSSVLPLNIVANADGFLSVFNKNDAGWYLRIAENGYPHIRNQEALRGFVDGHLEQNSWAFFPLFPFLIHTVANAFHVSAGAAAFIIIFLFSTGCFILFYQCAQLFLKDDEKAWYCTLLFIVFPFNYYYSMFYTEALFFTFMLGSILSVYYKKLYWLALLLPALVLSRPNGIVVAFIIFIYFLCQYWENKSSFRTVVYDIIKASAWFVVVPITFLSYGWYQYRVTGDFFAFSTAQYGWDRHDMFPFLALFRKSDLQNQFNSIYVCVILFLSILFYEKIPFPFQLLIWMTILLPLGRGSINGIPRYISILLPFYYIATQYLWNFRFRYYFLAILYVLQLGNLWFWFKCAPFSY